MKSAMILVLVAVSILFAWPQVESEYVDLADSGPKSIPESTRTAADPGPELSDTDLSVGHGDGHALGRVVRAGNLTIWPVLAAEVPDISPFRSLAEAQARGELGIREREDAEVATLLIENRGDLPILACAGALFVGGKQDRQLGQDIVVAAHSTVAVKTFCVEQNRWSGGRAFLVANVKASRAVRSAGQYDGDQSGVWKSVAAARASLGLKSGSYRAAANAGTKRAMEVLQHLRAQEGNLVGYAYAINGKVMGMRTFAHPALLEPRLDAMVRAVCAESEQSATGVPRPAAVSEEQQCMMIYLRMASDAYDDGAYGLAEAHAGMVLALDPGNVRAQELIRITKQSRQLADGGAAHGRFTDDWREIMAQLEANTLAAPGVLQYPADLRDLGVDARGLGRGDFVPPQITQVGVEEFDDSFAGSPANPGGGSRGTVPDPNSISSRGVASGGAALQPRGSFFFADGDLNVFVDIAALVRSACESAGKIVETNGVNRNRYAKTATGHGATCLIRTKGGRWIPLTRDWTAR